MFFAFQIPVVTHGGQRFPAAVVDVHGTRSGVSVQIYTNATRRAALKVGTLLQADVRSADYDSDPTPAVDYLLNAVLDELGHRRVRATRHRVKGWPTFQFNKPKTRRWSGWTNRARRIALK